MAVAQDGRCAICRKIPTTGPHKGKLAVDHCHTSGKVRGLLCNICNVGLGHSEDSVERLQTAILYLQRHALAAATLAAAPTTDPALLRDQAHVSLDTLDVDQFTNTPVDQLLAAQ